MTLERSIEAEPANDVLSKLDAINKSLGSVVETIRPPEKSIFDILADRQSSHVRFRGYELVIFAKSDADTIVLHIGQKTWTFTATFIDATGTDCYFDIVVPFPVLVDRGIDIWIAAGDYLTAWLTYTPE